MWMRSFDPCGLKTTNGLLPLFPALTSFAQSIGYRKPRTGKILAERLLEQVSGYMAAAVPRPPPANFQRRAEQAAAEARRQESLRSIEVLHRCPWLRFRWAIVARCACTIKPKEEAHDEDRFRRGDSCGGALFFRFMDAFFDLSVYERHHSIFHEDKWWIVYCFADAEHAEKFQVRFGGERFDPKDRGRGSNWARWYKTGR